MNQKGWIHRDIKAENVLISQVTEDEIYVKLCDFGFCTKKTDQNGVTLKLREVVGSPYYLAPEVLNQNYGQKCDLWSLGVLMYFILSNSFPF